MSAWGSFIVAAIALAQVWLIGLWRRFFRLGSIDIHESGLIEVGYSSFGPTIALYGTLRAVHRDQFVKAIRLRLVRARDGARHEFTWEAFRAGHSGVSTEQAYLIPAGFLVSQTQPHRYNIFFSDFGTREDVQAALAPVREAWNAKLAANPPADDGERAALFAEFSVEAPHYTAHAALGRILYWTQGDYQLTMIVETSRPDREFTRSWHFSLTPENEQAILLNSIGILADACGQATVFNFAYAEYDLQNA